MLGLADAYHLLGQDDLAGQWYQKGFAINPDVGAEHILKYITILSTSGNTTELRHWVTLYKERIAKSGELMDSVIFVTDNLTSLNSKSSDSAPLLYDSKMIFSSDRAVAGNFNSYKSALNSEGIFGEVSSFHAAVNSGRSEGGFAIATNAATLFFTGTEKESATAQPAMEIFTSAIPSGPSDQLKVNKLTFKNFDHSMGHPAINSNGTMLYFAAHSPKHTHGFDLYHSQYNGKKWSAPVALGTSVNSNGDELYPVLVNDSILYFTSNGRGGLGGFDIFRVNLQHMHHHQPEHLPAPINSPADEFGFILNSTGNEGYLSSNRPGGLGGNDLYRIYILPFKKKKHDAAPKKEELFVYTSKGDEIKLSGSSKENLKFDFQPGQKYNLVIEYDNFRTGTTQTIKNAAALTKRNVYTIDIQKSSEAVYDQKSKKSKPVQDIHLNPGDLVTFQLIPNQVQDREADVSKIQFQKSEVIVGDGQSIVFSYVAEGGPGISEKDLLPVADLGKLDSVSSARPLAANTPTAKSGEVAPTSTMSTLATTPASQKITTTDSTKTQVADVNRSAPTEALTSASASQKNATDNKSVNPLAEKTTAPLTVLPASAIALPVQSTTVKTNEAGSLAVAGNTVETQQQNLKSEQTPSVNKASPPAGANEVAAVVKTGEKNTVPSKNANDSILNKPSVTTKKNADTNVAEASPMDKVASTEVAATQALPVQNKAAQVTPLVVAAKTGEKNPTPSKDANDSILNKPSVTTKKNADTNVAEASPMDKVASTEVAATQALPVQNKAAQVTPLVVAAKTGEKNPTPSNDANDSILNKPSVTTKKNVDTNVAEASPTDKVASTEVAATQALLVQNKAAQVTPLVAAAKDGEKNSGLSKSANDTTLNKPSVTAKNNIDAKAKEPLPTNKVAATEVATTQVLPIQNKAAQTTPLVPASANLVSNTTDIQYRVQIAASTSKLSDDQLKKIYPGPKEIRSFSEDGYQKYYIEQTPSFPTAKRTMNESGVGQAFIAAYQGNKKLKLQEAIALQKKTGNQTSSSINKSDIANSATEPLSVATTQPNNSTEVLPEKIAPVTTESSKEKQVVATTQISQKASGNVPPPETKAQSTTPENKLPVSNDGANKPASVASAQPNNSSEALTQNIVPVTTESSKEKQVVAVTQVSQKASGNVPPPEAKAQSTTPENKLPVSNDEANKPASITTTQPNNSTEVLPEKTVPVKTEDSNEKQVVAAKAKAQSITPANKLPVSNGETKKPAANVPAPKVKTQDNAALEKPLLEIEGRNDFLYRLQIAASDARLSDTRLKKIYHGDNEVHTFKEDGKYKYYILQTSNYFVAHQALKKANTEQAFISAYKKDVKVPLEEAINAQYKVPVIKGNLAEVDSVIKITTVNFELDEFELQPGQLDRLRSTVISELLSNPSYRAIVNGYTDIRGSEAYNFGLSQERALFVEQHIVAEGIDAGRVTTQYFGESQLVKYCPEHENCDESIHQANRRVEILLLMDKK